MTKNEIAQELSDSYNNFTQYLETLSKDEFEYAPTGKWSAGQQAIHLIKSTKPLAKALGYPKFVIKQKFGKPNRESRDYDQLVARYREKLGNYTGEAPAAFAPESCSHKDLAKLVSTQKSVIAKISKKLDKWSEEQMDSFLLPHPLLGKVTVREMLYFTTYHAEHHQNLIKRYLKGI